MIYITVSTLKHKMCIASGSASPPKKNAWCAYASYPSNELKWTIILFNTTLGCQNRTASLPINEWVDTPQTGINAEAISEWKFLDGTSENSAYKNTNWFYQPYCFTRTSYTSAR